MYHRELCPEIYHKPYYQLDLVEIPAVERIIWIDEPGSDSLALCRSSQNGCRRCANDPVWLSVKPSSNTVPQRSFTSGTTGTLKVRR